LKPGEYRQAFPILLGLHLGIQKGGDERIQPTSMGVIPLKSELFTCITIKKQNILK
jgi:hypothetical protein